MTPEELTEKLADLNPNAILFEPRDIYDKAVIDLTDAPRDHWTRSGSHWVAVYDYDKLVECTLEVLGGEEGFDEHSDSDSTEDDDAESDAFDAAQEWVDFNMVGLWAGDGTPFIQSFDLVEEDDSGQGGDENGIHAEPESHGVDDEYVN